MTAVRLSAWLFLLTAFLMMGACTTLGEPQGPAESEAKTAFVPPASESEKLLAYFEWAQRLRAAELSKEREHVRLEMSAKPSDVNRLRFALVLAVPGGGTADDAQALEALDPVVSNRSSPLRTFAIMLRTLLAELHRAETEEAELRRKLDSLKALEKSLGGREGGGGK